VLCFPGSISDLVTPKIARIAELTLRLAPTSIDISTG
jgi:hypothetical protein